MDVCVGARARVVRVCVCVCVLSITVCLHASAHVVPPTPPEGGWMLTGDEGVDYQRTRGQVVHVRVLCQHVHQPVGNRLTRGNGISRVDAC